ncbi:MAG: hypothetical protein RBU21_08770, partial [FCB group bacterium]|nr:hypothetical protein [FCB group bacterium]
MADDVAADGGIAPEPSSDGAAGEPQAQPPSSPLLSNDDLDKLLASLEADEAPESVSNETPEPSPKPSIETGDLPEESAPSPAPASSTEIAPGVGDAPYEPASPAGKMSSEVLNGDELEKLMASMSAQAKLAPEKPVASSAPEEDPEGIAPEEDPPPPVGKQTTELLSNADLEKLLTSMNAKPAHAETAPPEYAEVEEKEPSQLLSNDDIDSLVASMNAAPPEP